jgi:hypothetical protein
VASRRCSLCGISYPSIPQFDECPIHGVPTERRANDDPDPNWKENFERLKKLVDREQDIVARPIPLVRGVEIVEENGHLFVPQQELWNAGLRLSRLQPDQFYLFEMEDGWIYETQGFDDPRRRWWVERVVEVQDFEEAYNAAHE